MDINSFLIGYQAGQQAPSAIADYNLRLAETMMTREAVYLSGDNSTLNLKGFKLSDGGILGNLAEYSFAGFRELEYISLADVIWISPYAFADNSRLKIIDITVPNTAPVLAFYGQSLKGCTSLESVVVRSAGADIQTVNMLRIDSATTDLGGVGANDTFYVYVPAKNYDAIVNKVNTSQNVAVPSSRYRKLEDYPEIDNWNKTFMVDFYDGDNLIGTQTVRYGQSAANNYSKPGYKFVGWNPEPTNVTEDMSCYAEWVPAALEDASWEQIINLSKAGKLSQHYAVGDEKSITLTYSDGKTENVVWMIAGFGKSALSDGSISNVDFVTKHALETARTMGSGSSFTATALRKWLDTEFYNALPDGLRNAILPKTEMPGWGSAYDLYCWIPCLAELGLIASGYSNINNNIFPLFSSDSKRVRTLGIDGAATKYWTSSILTSGSSNYSACVNTDGKVLSGASQAGTNGVVVGFCL